MLRKEAQIEQLRAELFKAEAEAAYSYEHWMIEERAAELEATRLEAERIKLAAQLAALRELAQMQKQAKAVARKQHLRLLKWRVRQPGGKPQLVHAVPNIEAVVERVQASQRLQQMGAWLHGAANRIVSLLR